MMAPKPKSLERLSIALTNLNALIRPGRSLQLPGANPDLCDSEQHEPGGSSSDSAPRQKQRHGSSMQAKSAPEKRTSSAMYPRHCVRKKAALLQGWRHSTRRRCLPVDAMAACESSATGQNISNDLIKGARRVPSRPEIQRRLASTFPKARSSASTISRMCPRPRVGTSVPDTIPASGGILSMYRAVSVVTRCRDRRQSIVVE